MKDIKIQRVSLNEIIELQRIARQTFSETYAVANTEENMKNYLKEGFALEKLTVELSNQNSEFYFALHQSEIIGYLKLNFGHSQTALKDSEAIEIERIYVLKDFHGKNVGKILYEKTMQIARRAKAEYIWLGVWEENPRAIAFYKKNGFREFDKHIFKLGNEEQTDLLMKVKLDRPNIETSPTKNIQ